MTFRVSQVPVTVRDIKGTECYFSRMYFLTGHDPSQVLVTGDKWFIYNKNIAAEIRLF